MKFTILLNNEDDSTMPLMVSQIDRTGPLQAATLGLTLAESKHLLAKVQKELVETQIQCYVQEQRICAQCGNLRMLKDYHTVCFKSLFGGVSLRIPRIYGCSCEGQDTKAYTVKIDGLVDWVSPELEFIQSQLAATIPYVPTAKLLALLLPVGAGNTPSTVRRRALRVGQRLDAELQVAADTEQVKHSEADAGPVTIVGLDSGYVHDFRPSSERSFEVVVGRILNENKGSRSLGFVRTIDSNDARMVKKLMRPVDGSISINRPNVPDNKLIDYGKFSALDSMGITVRYPFLDDYVPDESASSILAALASRKPHQIGSALTKLPLSLILPTVLHGRSNSDSVLEA